MGNYIGELSAFGTVICWVICSLAFEKAGKRIGSMPLNLIRLVIAFIFITIYTKITRNTWIPLDYTSKAWFWLSLSGIAGFFIGDLCLFRAFVTIGSRISLLIYSLSTPMAAIFDLIIFKQKMSLLSVLGMIITILGISLVILKKGKKLEFSHPIQGVLLAVIGALGQAAGMALSKLGMLDTNTLSDQFANTQIRIIAGTLCFSILFIFTKKWKPTLKALNNGKAMLQTTLGSFFGPFIGVTLGLVSISYIPMGVSSTITALVPVVIILPYFLLYKQKIQLRDILGAIIAVLGVSLLFI